MDTEKQRPDQHREFTGYELAPLGESPDWVRWAAARWAECQRKRGHLSLAMRRDMNHTTMGLEGMDRLIEWKLGKYSRARKEAREGTKMQEQWTIELRADFADKDKIPEVTKVIQSIARTMKANVQLLGPVCQPECVVFTDNFMSPPEKIDIYADLIGEGQAELAAVPGTATVTEPDDCGVSQDLLDAMK